MSENNESNENNESSNKKPEQIVLDEEKFEDVLREAFPDDMITDYILIAQGMNQKTGRSFWTIRISPTATPILISGMASFMNNYIEDLISYEVNIPKITECQGYEEED